MHTLRLHHNCKFDTARLKEGKRPSHRRDLRPDEALAGCVGFVPGGDGKPPRHRAMPEAGKLGKNEPHPSDFTSERGAIPQGRAGRPALAHQYGADAARVVTTDGKSISLALPSRYGLDRPDQRASRRGTALV
jgi:hypothetical protein